MEGLVWHLIDASLLTGQVGHTGRRVIILLKSPIAKAVSAFRVRDGKRDPPGTKFLEK